MNAEIIDLADERSKRKKMTFEVGPQIIGDYVFKGSVELNGMEKPDRAEFVEHDDGRVTMQFFYDEPHDTDTPPTAA